jgi:hypothetical protein
MGGFLVRPLAASACTWFPGPAVWCDRAWSSCPIARQPGDMPWVQGWIQYGRHPMFGFCPSHTALPLALPALTGYQRLTWISAHQFWRTSGSIRCALPQQASSENATACLAVQLCFTPIRGIVFLQHLMQGHASLQLLRDGPFYCNKR